MSADAFLKVSEQVNCLPKEEVKGREGYKERSKERQRLKEYSVQWPEIIIIINILIRNRIIIFFIINFVVRLRLGLGLPDKVVSC